MVKLLAVTLAFLVWLSGTSEAFAVPVYAVEPDPIPKTNVNLKVHISSITEISAQNENWGASGYLVYEWMDKRVEDGVYKDISELPWHPAIEIVNATDLTLIGQGAAAKDGKIVAQERIRFVASSGFEMGKFPFDTQNLDLAIESLQSPDLEFNNILFTISKDRFTNLSEWRVSTGPVSQTRNLWPPDDNKYSRMTYTVIAERNSAFYTRKIILPIIFLTCCSIAALFLNIRDSGTQLSFVSTTALASVTLWLLSADSIAKTPVNSVLDTIVYGSLLVDVVIVFFIIWMARTIEKRELLCKRWYRFLRIVLPIGYVAYNLFLIVKF